MAKMVEIYVPASRKLVLQFEAEDYVKREERKKRRNAFPEPTRDQLAFCKRLIPCPICGELPEPSIVGEYGHYSIKMNCSGSPFHIGCGDWKKTFAKAGKEWNERTRDDAQIRFDLENERLWKKMKKDEKEGV